VLKAAVQEHSAELIKKSLPPSSVLMMTVAPGGAPAVASIASRVDRLMTWIDEEEAVNASGGDYGGRYIPDWERLIDAVKRVMATGVTEAGAKFDLCRAISDRKIRVRFLVAKSDGPGLVGERIVNEVRLGSDAEVPLHLKPDDFEWRQSRPVKPWFENRRRAIIEPQNWHLDWIELFRADVTNVLCSSKRENHDGPARAASKSKSGAGAKARGIGEAINQLWPEGIPKGLSAKERNKAIIDWLSTHGYSQPTNPERAIQRVLKQQLSEQSDPTTRQ
jgi:hypothetical protein